jgi:hypothetical protein
VRRDGQARDVARARDGPARGDAAVDGHRRGAAERELERLHLGGDDALAVGVGEQRLVPVREEARGEGRRGGRERLPGEVEQRRAALVAVLDGVQALPRVREVALGDAGPARRVAPARGPERGEVAGEHERGGAGEIGEGPRVDDEARPAAIVPRPGRRELHERQQDAGEDDRRPRLLRDALVAADALADLHVRARLAQPRAELRGHLRLVEVRVLLAPGAHADLAHELRVGGVLAGRREVQRHPHQRRLDDGARGERGLEALAGEAVEPRGERDVGRGRMLALERRQAPDRLGRVEPEALDQPLAGGEGGGQLRAGERPHRPEPTQSPTARRSRCGRRSRSARSACRGG